MSSHHFVKEGQEPALILGSPFDEASIGPLLEWAPVVITLPGAIDQLIERSIKTDVVVMPASEERKITLRMEHQAPFRFISTRGLQDPLTTAFDYLISRGQFEVNVWVDDARQIFDRAEDYVGRLGICIIDTHTKWSAIRSGNFKKWYPANSMVQIRSKHGFIVSGTESSRRENQIEVLETGILEISSLQSFWVSETLG